jgi:hypothetical protein
MTAVNAAVRRPAIGLIATTNGNSNMSPINGVSRRPGVGLITAATEAVKTSAVNAIRREPGVGVVSITTEILQAPFAFGSQQADRPAELGHSYLIDAAVLFLATTLLGALGSLIWPDPTLLVAQSVLIGVLVLALAAGNGVALAFAQFGGAYVDTGDLRSAAKYAAGFSLLLMSVFNLVGFFGSAIVPVYSGSILEALTVLSGMGVVLSAAFLLVEWPRRIVGLDEGAFYTGVGGVFLVAGLLLKATGIA